MKKLVQTCVLALCATNALAATKFTAPTLNGRKIDAAFIDLYGEPTWGGYSSEIVAHKFCRVKGFSGSVDWVFSNHKGSTYNVYMLHQVTDELEGGDIIEDSKFKTSRGGRVFDSITCD